MRFFPAAIIALTASAMAEKSTPNHLRKLPADKVDVCHNTEGTQDYIKINIAEAAFPAHVDHGDNAPGEPVPGMEGYIFSDDCVPELPCVVVSLSLLTDGKGLETGWEFKDSMDQVLASAPINSLSDNFLYEVDLGCLDPEDCYTYTIFDSPRGADGICCASGSGTWSIDFGGVITVSPLGGEFGTEESVNFGACSTRRI